MSWKQLNFLVPEPDCDTVEGVITEWRDSRPQPTDAAINAVSLTAIEARNKSEAFDKEVESFSPALKAMFDQLETDIPGFSGRAKIRHDQGVV